MSAKHISAMVRTAIMVSNLESSRSFYNNVLGLSEVFYEGELSEGNAHRLLVVPEGTLIRAVILKADGPAFGMVGLFELSDPKPVAIQKDINTTNIGDTCLVFYCKDLDPVTEKLKAGRHTILSEPTALEIDGYKKQREMIFRDPDGVMINLIEWDPQQERRPEHQSGDKQ